MSQSGEVSADGMWRWDGAQWLPTDKQNVLPEVTQTVEMVSAPEPTGAMFGRGTPDKRAEKEAAKQRAAAEKESQRRRATADKEAREFAASPVGRARASFARGDEVFQYSIDVMSQQAIIVVMVGSATAKRTSDPSDVLNAVSREGWELVNGSFVFVEEGQQSRDKFMASGQNVAIKGTTVGYYLFKRNPALRKVSGAGLN
jgi:hypothetical protein